MSMTGYGRGVAENSVVKVTVEIRSVNHRFSEIVVRLPRPLMMEEKLKKIVGGYVHRGRVEVFVNVDGEGLVTRKLHTDWSLADGYMQVFEQAKKRFQKSEELTLVDLLKLEGVTTIVEASDTSNDLEELVICAMKEAMEQLIFMRQKEGEALFKALSEQINIVEQTMDELNNHTNKIYTHYHEKMLKKVNEFLHGKVDETRILTEVAIFAEKADVEEEITRIYSHLEQFQMTLLSSESIGRKLDFIVQELQRELNTIAAKAYSSEVKTPVVQLKSVVEKMKEQVQNVE